MIIVSESAPDIFPVDTAPNKLVTLDAELVNTESVTSDKDLFKGIMGEANDEDEIAKNKYDNRALDRTKANELLAKTIHSCFFSLKIEAKCNKNPLYHPNLFTAKLKANKDR